MVIFREDIETAYRLANRAITKCDERTDGLRRNRRRATDAIKKVVEEAAVKCDLRVAVGSRLIGPARTV